MTLDSPLVVFHLFYERINESKDMIGLLCWENSCPCHGWLFGRPFFLSSLRRPNNRPWTAIFFHNVISYPLPCSLSVSPNNNKPIPPKEMCHGLVCVWWRESMAKDRKVIPDPIDDRKFQEWKESGKSGILLAITLNPRKCIGEKVRRIPINVETKW